MGFNWILDKLFQKSNHLKSKIQNPIEYQEKIDRVPSGYST